jgi:hypothetical protein
VSGNQVLVVVGCDVLGDGSEVYNVRIGGLLLHALTEENALQLADKLRDAIGLHTLERVQVAYS